MNLQEEFYNRIDNDSGYDNQKLGDDLIEIAKKHLSKQFDISGVSKRLSIKLKDWHYQCGDGCCDMYGTEITLNDKVCDNQYAGNDVRTALEFVLTELGYEVDIDFC